MTASLTRGRAHTPRWARWPLVVTVALLLGIQTLLGSPAATADPGGDCAESPAPEAVSSGLTGTIDPAKGQGLADSVYEHYGYAGQVWHTYDAADNPLCSNTFAEVSTWVGNQLFNVGKTMTAGVNSLHYMLHEGGLAWQMDKVIKTGAEAAFDSFAAPFVGLALLLVGIVAFWAVFHGRMSDAAKSGGRVALGLTLVAATAFSPLIYTNLFDDLLIDGFKTVENEIGSAMSSDDGDDDVSYREVLPTKLHHEIVVKNWARGEFGNNDTKLAKELGPKLVDAQACSWGEVSTDSCDVDQKDQEFQKIAEKVQDKGDYSTFTGESGGRMGTGALAAIQSVVFGLLQLMAKLALLLSQLVLRVFVLFGPIIGILAMAPGVGRTVLRGVLGVGVLGLVFNVVAGVHSFIIIKLLSTDLSMMMKLVVATLLTMLIWSVLRPVKRIKTMVASSMYTMPGQNMHRVGQWLQHRHLMQAMRPKANERENRWWKQRGTSSDSDGSKGEASGWEDASGWQRPEGETAGAASAAGPTAGRTSSPRGGPDAPGAGSGPPPPPRPPRSPSGTGGASPGVVRAEATRLDTADSAAPSSKAGARPGEDRPTALPGRHTALPAGHEPQQDHNPPQEGRSELVRPTEVLSADESSRSDLRPARTTEDSNGTSAHVLYNPRTGRMERDQPSANENPSSPRPEMTETDAPADRSEPSGGTDADPY